VKVLICGSRDWPDIKAIHDRVRDLIAERGPFEIVHGGARGADSMAGLVAEWCRLPCARYPADWERYGKRAGIIRNLQMLDTNPDLVLAFRVNGSRGTTHMIEAAKKAGVPVEVIAIGKVNGEATAPVATPAPSTSASLPHPDVAQANE
jgi:hypothetical protein